MGVGTLWDVLLWIGLFYLLFHLAAMPRLVFETVLESSGPLHQPLQKSAIIFLLFAIPYLVTPLVPFFRYDFGSCLDALFGGNPHCMLTALVNWYGKFSTLFVAIMLLTGVLAILAAVWGAHRGSNTPIV